MYHESYHSLKYGPDVFKGPSERTLGIVSKELGKMTTPKLSTLQIGAGTDIPALRALLMKSISEVAIPFLSELDSLEKIAAYYISRNIPAEATIVAAIYLIRGRFDDAEAVIQEAGKNAPTDHVREQNEKSFKKMLAKLG